MQTQPPSKDCQTLPALPPLLPEGVVTFDCVDFGGFCPRGYNPNQIAGSIRDLPIVEFGQGAWLSNPNTGMSGSVFVFRDAMGREIGRAFKPSQSVVFDLCSQGKWPVRLVFTPTTDTLKPQK